VTGDKSQKQNRPWETKGGFLFAEINQADDIKP